MYKNLDFPAYIEDTWTLNCKRSSGAGSVTLGEGSALAAYVAK